MSLSSKFEPIRLAGYVLTDIVHLGYDRYALPPENIKRT